MSLTAFNRLRRMKQVEEMKPENIMKKYEEPVRNIQPIPEPVEEPIEEKIEEPVEEVEEEKVEEIAEEKEEAVSEEAPVEEPVIAPRRRNNRRTSK